VTVSWRQGAGQWGARARDWAYLRASDQVRRAQAARTPLSRNASPPDIAGAIALLASPLAGFRTGAYLPANGVIMP
jgi:NAD(P)-dependent dehydrogenase (short-subunit alcohol dehydrogenase family)